MNSYISRAFLLVMLLLRLATTSFSQPAKQMAVIAYYSGKRTAQLDSFAVEKLTHIIFSFCHLKGHRLNVDDAQDSAMIREMVSLKSRNPKLKVILSLGGWGGCATCSDVFATKAGRKEFAASVKQLSEYFGSDGIDLDWEYPAIAGYPGHRYQSADRRNFTRLVRRLRSTLGKRYEISFAAGGFTRYINKSVDWKRVMKMVNYVNLMTYDLVSGYSRVTGHHTPLYSTSQQVESVDNAVRKLIDKKISPEQIIIGAAFYGRAWDSVPDVNSGLYQPGSFLKGIPYRSLSSQCSPDSGFVYHWDEKAAAPYIYNPQRHVFVTYDDRRSVGLKTQYVREKNLAGIMFWQLADDSFSGGLLDAIDKAKDSPGQDK